MPTEFSLKSIMTFKAHKVNTYFYFRLKIIKKVKFKIISFLLIVFK